MIGKIASLLVICLLAFPAFSQDAMVLPIDEFEFIKKISGKDKDYVTDNLGKPFSIKTKENEGGVVRFMVYKNIVKIAGTDKIYKYTQVGVVNDAVETVGNTNLQPE